MTAPLKRNVGWSIYPDAEQPPQEAHAAHPALDVTRGDMAAHRTSGFSADAATNIRSRSDASRGREEAPLPGTECRFLNGTS